MQKKKKKKKERKIPAWWWAIEQLIVSWEIKTPVKERSRNSLLVISFLLRRRLAWSFFSKKKKSLLKGNEGVRRHKGRLSTFHWADKRKKSQLRLITTKVMKETKGDRKERKSLLILTWEKVERSTVPPETQSCGVRPGRLIWWTWRWLVDARLHCLPTTE